MQPEQPHKIGRIFGALMSVLFVGLSIALFLNRQNVLDHVVVWQNQPVAQVVKAADRVGLNDNGKFLLYASVPQVQDKQAFNASCSSISEEAAVLGCYSAQRVYILDVTDKRLDGIEEVTMAHEMLHAAYERLSASERSRVDALIEAQYAKNTDPALAGLVSIYAKSEPGERLNELHSIYATSVESLSPELETYYQRYFTDRSRSVALHDTYSAVFDEMKQQQQALVDILNEQAKQINEAVSLYNVRAEQLSNDIQRFNADADSYTSQSAFNRDRQALVVRQQQLKSDRESIQAQIDEYDSKKRELDALNIQAAELNQSINSNIDETPSL